MLSDPSKRYNAFHPINLPDRRWPSQQLTRPPVWMSTDLRDGNQALFEPMDIPRKLRMFKMLCDIGFKEIEVGFPSASQTEFDFIRTLIEGGHIPNDVTIEVLTQARDHLITRTFESLRGAPRAIVHVYNATSPVFRRTVFNVDRAGCIQIAVDAAKQIYELAEQNPATDWRFQYSPETFTATELDFALEISERVLEVWQASKNKPVIINLPATVEVASPNIFADQVEWMSRNFKNRDAVILSVHPHNDRGCAVAAAELAMMAGADRVEGCLFGNGERTGNVDLVTLALNFYTQGIHPGLDFSNINEITRMAEECTGLPVHPRHPYAGDLVFTAFSGSHQDAIKKGFASQSSEGLWEVPYLPLDPADVGRTYDSIIRVNSQSGKGGISYLLEHVHGLIMPRRMQVEFSGIVQQAMDDLGKEMTAQDLWQIFEQAYLHTATPLTYVAHHLFEDEAQQGIELVVRHQDQEHRLRGSGNGPIDAAIHAITEAFGISFKVQSFEERSLSQGENAQAVAFVEMSQANAAGTVFGAGISANIITASLRALISGINRLASKQHSFNLQQPVKANS